MPYLQPTSLNDALTILRDDRMVLAAGCTDFFPSRETIDTDLNILDTTRIAGLRGIEEISSGWRIGATTTWTDVIEAPLPAVFDALKLAAREVGARQIQNTGTVVGNICNASPAADGIPPLLALDAEIEISSAGNVRCQALGDFITGVRQINLAPNEMVTAIIIPSQPDGATSDFQKLGSRSYLIISIAMVAVIAKIEGDMLANVRIAVGACSPVAQRLPDLEARLNGLPLKALRSDTLISRDDLKPLNPLSDVRASEQYRLDAAGVLCQRVLLTAIGTGSDNG